MSKNKGPGQGGARPGSGRPKKDGARRNLKLARDVIEIIEARSPAFGSETSFIEHAVRTVAALPEQAKYLREQKMLVDPHAPVSTYRCTFCDKVETVARPLKTYVFKQDDGDYVLAACPDCTKERLMH